MDYRVRCPKVTTSISDDNLRGERRWERNVLDALLQDKRKIYLHHSLWKVPATPSGLHIDTNEVPKKVSLGISHSSPTSLFSVPEVNHHIFNFFNAPSQEVHKREVNRQLEEIRNKLGTENVLLTYNFRHLVGHGVKTLDPGAIWIPTPAIKEISSQDNFDCKTLLWSSRFIMSDIKGYHEQTKLLFQWIAQKMKLDEELKFEIMLGYGEVSLRNAGYSDYSELVASFWKLPLIQQTLAPLKSRVILHGELNWKDVMELNKRSKLVVSFPKRYGGPPLEAAVYGVPTVGLSQTSSFHLENGRPAFDNYLSISGDRDKSFVSKLEKLYSDHSYYRLTGDVYRDYTEANYSYSAFLRRIDEICTERKWT